MEKILRFFRSEDPVPTSPHDGMDAGDFAAMCLLVSAAYIEDGCDPREESALRRMATDGFGLDADEVEAVLSLAISEEREASDLFRWTKRVNESYEYEHKISLLEKMWEVVASDGVIGDFESNLLRRVSGLLYVSDKDAGEARRRVLRRMEGQER